VEAMIATLQSKAGEREPVEAPLSQMNAFLQAHRSCGEISGGCDRQRVWMSCGCGATLLILEAPVDYATIA